MTVLAGCGLRPGRKGDAQSAWMSSRYSSADADWLYSNFYFQLDDFGRYQRYGLVNYSRDSTRDSQRTDEALLEDALRLCREEFHEAFNNQSLTRWDSDKSDLVPFKMKYVAVVIVDKQERLPQSGVVVPAKQLFSDAKIKEVLSNAKISRGNLWFEDISEEEKQQGYSPGMVIRYLHVEEHMSQMNRSDQPVGK